MIWSALVGCFVGVIASTAYHAIRRWRRKKRPRLVLNAQPTTKRVVFKTPAPAPAPAPVIKPMPALPVHEALVPTAPKVRRGALTAVELAELCQACGTIWFRHQAHAPERRGTFGARGCPVTFWDKLSQ